jgi:cell wall-associated NlpC family hydrolase
MRKLKAALTALEDKLGLNERLLSKARRRHKKFRLRNEAELKRRDAHTQTAHGYDTYGPNEDQVKSDRYLRASLRCQHRADRSHAKAVFWKGRIKQQVARVHHLEKSQADLKAELSKWKKEHGVEIHGNKVTGGTARQRLRAALLRAMLNYKEGRQPGYYSESGLARVYSRMLEKMPFGHIFDCSTFADGIYDCCELTDPSATDYTEGWTGTEGEHGKRVSESEAQVGDLVLFGPQPHHHVEVVLDPARKTTVGHGSPPIDEGIFDLFGDGDYEIRSYL